MKEIVLFILMYFFVFCQNKNIFKFKIIYYYLFNELTFLGSSEYSSTRAPLCLNDMIKYRTNLFLCKSFNLEI